MQFSASQPVAGWYPDPAGSGDERYWDGSTWSQVTRPSSLPPEPGYQVPISPRYAGWWTRVGAFMLDMIILALPYYLLVQWLAASEIQALTLWWQDVFVAAAQRDTTLPDIPQQIIDAMTPKLLIIQGLVVLYEVVFLAVWGATLGKMIMQIRVVPDADPAKQSPGLWRAALRQVGLWLFGFTWVLPLISYLMPLFTPKKQALHDLLASTVVVKNS